MIEAKQPDWVCTDCGIKYGRWHQGEYSGPNVHAATYHVDQCDVCKKTKNCTEARDFGYLINNWRLILNEI